MEKRLLKTFKVQGQRSGDPQEYEFGIWVDAAYRTNVSLLEFNGFSGERGASFVCYLLSDLLKRLDEFDESGELHEPWIIRAAPHRIMTIRAGDLRATLHEALGF